MKKALILIDIQNDFVPGGALAVRNGDAVIPVANALTNHVDLVVANPTRMSCVTCSFLK